MTTYELSLASTPVEFETFGKIHRLFRPVTITEKIDGTNAAVGVYEPLRSDEVYGAGDGMIAGPGLVLNRDETGNGWDPLYVYAQSRKRIISPEADNFGFARWVREHAHELARGLGPGLHYGEWWGNGIQRGYGLDEKRFSLFNTDRWGDDETRPGCCHVVPVLLRDGELGTSVVLEELERLADTGSHAAPGFMDPEGIVVFHHHSRALFKVTIDDDHKGAAHGA